MSETINEQSVNEWLGLDSAESDPTLKVTPHRDVDGLPPDKPVDHPKNIEIYGEGVHESFVERCRRHGIEEVKITFDSHFTDAEWTYIGGHRRKDAAIRIDEIDEIDVEVVGPFETPEEELRAVLKDNDYRHPTPAQEIRIADQWIEVYENSPDLETDSAVQEACQHVSFGDSTYWKGKKVQKAADDGVLGIQNPVDLPIEAVDVAKKQWKLLEDDETKIGTAFEAIKTEKERVEEISRAEELRGDVVNLGFDESGELEEDLPNSYTSDPAQAALNVKDSKIKTVLTQISLPQTLAGLNYVFLVATNEGLHLYKLGENLKANYSLSVDFFEDYKLMGEAIGIVVVLDDLRNYFDLMDKYSDKVRIEFRGEEGSRYAENLIVSDGQLHIGLHTHIVPEDHRELPDHFIAKAESDNWVEIKESYHKKFNKESSSTRDESELREIGLVTCTKKKISGEVPPGEKYTKSSYFRKMKQYSKAKHESWYILSAKHGLLDPDGPPIEDYDKTLDDANVDERRAWAQQVSEELEEEGLLEDDVKLVVHASQAYYEELIPLIEDEVAEIEIPTEGLGMGPTRSWYTDAVEDLEAV